MKVKTFAQTKAMCYITAAGRSFEAPLKLDGRYTRPIAFKEAFETRYPTSPVEILTVNELIINTTKKIKF